MRYMPPKKFPASHNLKQVNDGGILIPKGGYLILDHGLKPNGSGKQVNQYSILMDIRLPKLGVSYALYNSNYNNSNGAEAIINPNGQVGSSDFSDFKMEANLALKKIGEKKLKVFLKI